MKEAPAMVESEIINMVESEIINKIRRSHQGAKFEALYYKGDISAYGGDDSAADQALMNILAWWTNSDISLMEKLFSHSALAKRDKWIKRPDYRERTIQAAVKGIKAMIRRDIKSKRYWPNKKMTKKALTSLKI